MSSSLKIRINIENGVARMASAESTPSKTSKRKREATTSCAQSKECVEEVTQHQTSDRISALDLLDFANSVNDDSNDSAEECVVLESISATPVVMQFAHSRSQCLNKDGVCDKCFCEICDLPVKQCKEWEEFHKMVHETKGTGQLLDALKELSRYERSHGRTLKRNRQYPLHSKYVVDVLQSMGNIISNMNKPGQQHFIGTPDWCKQFCCLLAHDNACEFFLHCVATDDLPLLLRPFSREFPCKRLHLNAMILFSSTYFKIHEKRCGNTHTQLMNLLASTMFTDIKYYMLTFYVHCQLQKPIGWLHCMIHDLKQLVPCKQFKELATTFDKLFFTSNYLPRILHPSEINALVQLVYTGATSSYSKQQAWQLHSKVIVLYSLTGRVDWTLGYIRTIPKTNENKLNLASLLVTKWMTSKNESMFWQQLLVRVVNY